MTIGTIPVTITIPNDQPWSEDIRYWLNTAKTSPATITDAIGWLKSKTNPNAAPFALSVMSSRLVISGGIVGIRVTAAGMATIPPGSYTLEIKATDSSTAVRQLRGDVKVVAGLGF